MTYPAQIHASKTFEKLAKGLPETEQSKLQIVLLAGAVTPYRDDTDREMPFRQESNFYYLSGCNIPGSYLVLVHNPNAASPNQGPQINLFIPEIVPADLMWSVPPPTLDEATKSFPYATSIGYTSSLAATLTSVIQRACYSSALIHILPLGSPLFPTLDPEYTKLVSQFPYAKIQDTYLLPALHGARLIKTAYEIEEIRKANAISSRAHEVVMRMLGRAVKGLVQQNAKAEQPLLPHEWLIEKEAEGEAVFVASCRREGSLHQAYMPIVASSNRAATLHYCCNDKDFAWGPVGVHDHLNSGSLVDGSIRALKPQVLLIDAGCEWNNYASDITRTMPVGNGGKFTPEARAIYDLVLDMQKASLDYIKLGIHWDTVQLLCHRVLVRGFHRLGIFHPPSTGSWNSEESILASGVSAAFFPHGVGHSLGLDVHDVPSASKPPLDENLTIGVWRKEHEVEKGEKVVDAVAFYEYLRLRVPLEEGMVVTVEPGIYFHSHLLSSVRDSRHINHEVLKRYETVGGVRIEDVVLITKEGHENLTTVRKETDWVESVCSGEL